ncbi:mechanosensitive ion channel family protein [Subdoligranulum variabile]|uniref:Transporter, small conductance mechanosensitive ion channel MscS family protein n=1 Tax=Subdoligranulum variabile DSM 15176 TaxID=411471 RepID=D1PL66_9FIRM|nr:mechanosensitive ion channel family protein [Subdoligranulum variabile]EFB76724.1 transporter, small conductance mechanosensitive ion channel MscS family protein [Subdoligranulum variabile DSM 15176]UWP68049.1 mechanosensitive ion channel family protein [Subdoligranulum variabile]
MQEFTISLVLDLLPTVLFLLGALVLPLLYTRIIRRVLDGLHGHLTEWLYILFNSYVQPTSLILRSVLLYLALMVVPFTFNSPTYQTVLRLLFDLALTFLLGLGAWRAAPMCRLLLRSAQNKLDLTTNNTMGRFFENIFRALVAVFTGIAILDRLGVPVTGLLTGAGVAGLAVSLAAQSTLSNLIAGITLVLEHPFGIGDYVILGSSEGTVEDISFRSTRIRTTDNVAVTIENSKICSEYIQNCNQRSSRLWQFTLGLTYDATREQLDTVCRDLTELLKAQPTVQADTVTATVDKFNDYSIDILVRLYVTTLPYGDFLREKSRLNLEIMQLVARDGCSFAFPTTTLDMPAKN